MSRRVLALLLLMGCRKSEPDLAAIDAAGSEAEVTDVMTTDASVEGLEDLLEPVRAANDLPALAGAVFSSDGLLAIGAVGVRKLGDATKVTRDDMWHLGSDTKAMTATLLALYVKESKLAWDTTMAQAFPGDAASFDAAYRPVTIEQLLQHRGGAPANVPSDLWTEMWKPGDPMVQRRAAVIAMLQRPPETPPGTKYVYANAGYMMAGAALEERTKTAWEATLRARVFDVLSMTTCGYGAPASIGMVDAPWGHANKSGTLTPIAPGPGADNPPSLGPAGTVHCSLQDWGKFLIEHLRGARSTKTTLAVDWTKLHTPPSGGDYALGWAVTDRSWGGGTVLTHSGSNTMFFATVWIAPAKDRVFVAATNRGDDVAAKGVDAAFGPMIARFAK